MGCYASRHPYRYPPRVCHLDLLRYSSSVFWSWEEEKRRESGSSPDEEEIRIGASQSTPINFAPYMEVDCFNIIDIFVLVIVTASLFHNHIYYYQKTKLFVGCYGGP